jgi:hypothetical protein
MGLKKTFVRFSRRLLVGSSLILLLAGWGQTGHQIINRNVILHLPPSMGRFVQQVSFLSSHASDADNRKSGDNQKPYSAKEGPRHFIDIDSYPEFASHTVPMDFSAAISLYDSATVFNIGVNPWACVWTLDSLTAQMQRNDWNNVWQSAADLGHYVGDAHQPLHNTQDYDGRSSVPGSKGIHSRYETGMVNTYQAALTIRPDSVHYVPNPIDFVFAIAYQSNSYVDSIYDADIYARQVSGWSGSGSAPSTYYAALWEKTGGFTKLQFQRATETYADLLYTAWVDAGSPDLTGVSRTVASLDIPREVWLGQNYPNPFNPSTTILYRVPENAHVALAVYTLRGRKIAVLADGRMAAGEHTSVFDAGNLSLSSGTYVYRLQVTTNGRVSTTARKLLLLK